MPHFNKTTPGSKIHTTRGGGPCPHAKANPPPGGRPSCNYRKHSGGFPYKPWQAHHILCIEAINEYGSLLAYKNYVTKIDDCYKMTDWCINQAANLKAMPHKPVYRKFKNSRSMDIPCHDWDHNCIDGYFDEIVGALHKQVWSPIKKAVDQAAKQEDHFGEYSVLKQFKKLEKQFQKELVRRGKRNGGTKNYSNQRSETNGWWMPFSMAKDSVAQRNKVFSL